MEEKTPGRRPAELVMAAAVEVVVVVVVTPGRRPAVLMAVLVNLGDMSPTEKVTLLPSVEFLWPSLSVLVSLITPPRSLKFGIDSSRPGLRLAINNACFTLV
nr:hypothetical protein BaRGS_025132 [Batillaria attramentaria]